jgi:DNA-nicking Smr family endonuclease
MHQDHKKWLSDNDMWRCDISAWQEEFRQAAADLKEIETAVKEHEKALQTHAAAIRLREQELAAHEHALAEYERGETGAALIALVKTHEKEAAKHAQQNDAHERIKRHHHEVIAHVSLLRKALAKAE